MRAVKLSMVLFEMRAWMDPQFLSQSGDESKPMRICQLFLGFTRETCHDPWPEGTRSMACCAVLIFFHRRYVYIWVN